MLVRSALSNVIGLLVAANFAVTPASSQCTRLLLTPGDPTKGDTYGTAVGLHAGRAVVGSPRDDPNGTDSGSAYVHDLVNGGPPVKLIPADGDVIDEFGVSVAIWGDTVAIGVPGDDDACPGFILCNSGTVRIFRESGGAWLPEAVVVGLDTVVADQLGWSVALEGDTLLVGAPTADPACPANPLCNSGAVYVFQRQGASWIQVQKLVPAGAAAGDWFGTAVALDGDRAVIGGAFSNSTCGLGGTAFVFDRVAGVWTETARLEPLEAAPAALFGFSADLDGDVIVVGAPEFSLSEAKEGAAHVFEFDGRAWRETAMLRALNPGVLDTFGVAVAVEGDRVFASVTGGNGASVDSGMTSIHARAETGWEHEQNLSPDNGQPGDVYGSALAVDDGRLLVGARLADAPALNSGAAYLHWMPQGQALLACSEEISVALGGGQQLLLHGGPALAGKLYLLLGSASGTAPWSPVGGFELPLVADSYTALTLAAPNLPPLTGSLGVFDGEGLGHAAFGLAPGGDPALVGLTLYHAFVVLDPPSGLVLGVSNAEPVLLAP